MTDRTPLSPAAQAVLDAYDNSPFDDDIGDRVAIAAALRAAANAVEITPYRTEHAEFWSALHDIAAELENHAN